MLDNLHCAFMAAKLLMQRSGGLMRCHSKRGWRIGVEHTAGAGMSSVKSAVFSNDACYS